MAEHVADPLELLATWASEAVEAQDGSDRPATLPPTTMTLATSHPQLGASARTVAVTRIDGDGVRFHSSPGRKTADLAADPRASGVFLWPAQGRQVVVSGQVVELDDATTAAAFVTRPRQLRLLAWTYADLADDGHGDDGRRHGEQQPGAVEAAFAAAAARPGTDEAPPPGWTTFVLVPVRVEAWVAGAPDAPATRWRHLREVGAAWRRFPVLP